MDFSMKLHSSFSTTALNTTNQSAYPNTQQTMVKGSSSAFLSNPYTEFKIGKFPKGKSVRRQTSISMMTETGENKHVSSIKNCSSAYRTTLFEIQENRKAKADGSCYFRSLESVKEAALNRSFGDLGIYKNRKNPGKYKMDKPNPILVGEPAQDKRSYLKKIEAQPRRHRDRGNRITEHTIWEKVKPKTYLEKFRAKNALAQSQR